MCKIRSGQMVCNRVFCHDSSRTCSNLLLRTSSAVAILVTDPACSSVQTRSFSHEQPREIMATKAKETKEVDYVSKQANLTSQIESERLAAKKWWEEYGTCYLDNAKLEDFTYENRIAALKGKLGSDKYQNATLHTTSADYGCRPPFKECTRKKV